MQLRDIRELLRRCEDSIIFALLERARWKRNQDVYANCPSLFTDLLQKTERAHSEVGRYQCPEEHPFTHIKSPSEHYQNKKYQLSGLLMEDHKTINHNAKILELYLEKIIPTITPEGEDENAGSAAVADVNLLQAISRRIHLGKVVAEIKFSQPGGEINYRKCQNYEDLMNQLTNEVVEHNILLRIREKSNIFGGNKTDSYLPEEVIVSIFRDFIIPLTKEIQVEYLQRRLSRV